MLLMMPNVMEASANIPLKDITKNDPRGNLGPSFVVDILGNKVY